MAYVFQEKRENMASIIPWEVPDWVPNCIRNIPTHKAKLIANPTPIQRWHVSSLSGGFENTSTK